MASSKLGKMETENSDEDLCGDEHGVRKFRRGRTLTSLWATLFIAAAGVQPPLDLQVGHPTTIDQNVNPEEASQEKVQVAATQKSWCVTEAWWEYPDE